MAEPAKKTPVEMTDGRTVEFNAKQRLVKESTIADDGSVTTVLDFVNGQTRSFTIKPADELYSRFCAHGAEQKLGDAIAGEKDIDDAVLSVDDLLGRLANNEWTMRREGGGFAGTSVLIQALMEASGKELADVKAFLEGKTQAEKLALRRSDKLRPIVEKIEAEKASKSKSKVDTDALLGELGLDAPAKGGKKS